MHRDTPAPSAPALGECISSPAGCRHLVSKKMSLEHLYKFDWYVSHQAWLNKEGYMAHDHRGTKPQKADLRGTDLRGADLLGAKLCDANLRDANLRDANLRGSNLRNADLSCANFNNADLCFASLYDTNLHYANLRHANLSYANLCGADLRHADLRGADLRHADLRDTDLSYANLCGADLRYADLRGADLRHADLRNTIGNGREIITILTDKWIVNITKEFMTVGCEHYSIKDWMSFDDDRISKMDPCALHWSRIWKPIIKQIIEATK